MTSEDAADSAGCAELPDYGLVLGVLMGVVGSVGINIGQNIQASGLQKLPDLERAKPCKSRMWQIGLAIFITFSLVNFAALALAPASILTPLESIQFVTNVIYNKFVNKAVVSQRMVLGVGLALVGTVLSVVFGASSGGCHSLQTLESFWLQWAWWLYLGSSLLLAVGAFVVHRLYVRRLSKGNPLPHHRLVMPVAYTLAAALAGGAQMIVHSKVFSEVLALLLSGSAAPAELRLSILRHWLIYVEVVLVTVHALPERDRTTQCASPARALPLAPCHRRL